MPDATRKLIKGVSIHAPARGATKIVRSLYHYYYVSIHAPARGATKAALRKWYLTEFQSTRPRGARPVG